MIAFGAQCKDAMEALQRSVQYQQRTLLADVAQVSVVCVLRVLGVRVGAQATQDVTKQLTEKQHHAALTMDKLLQTSSELVQVLHNRLALPLTVGLYIGARRAGRQERPSCAAADSES